MANITAAQLASRLAREAEAVCRHYLSNGRREGHYWKVGDVYNRPGRSMYVRLMGPECGPGAAGKWTDAATPDHGDLLDVIRIRCGLGDFQDVIDEAQRFLALPRQPAGPNGPRAFAPAKAGSSEAARRLFHLSGPIVGTIAETYLRRRGITLCPEVDCLRFHPRCLYRPDANAVTETWPAMIAAVTDEQKRLTGVHRTWLDPSGRGKAPIDTPRRAMGQLLGHAVRFGQADDVLVIGEGLETVLSIQSIAPALPVAATLSAAHLQAFCFPPSLCRLYVARDDDLAGDSAFATLVDRAASANIQLIGLSPRRGDFNEDLQQLGSDAVAQALRAQLTPQDAARFLTPGSKS